MSGLAVETSVSQANPVDTVEEVAMAREWAYERPGEEEMVVEITGRWCDHRMFFVWQSEVNALQFSCQFDMKVPAARRTAVNELLAEVNSKMWLGHFDIDMPDQLPMFRYTFLLRGVRGASAEQVEDLVEIAVAECERFYPAFQFVVWGGKTASEAVSAAILDTVGEA